MDIDFLWWVRNVFFFPGDAMKALMVHGIEESEARFLIVFNEAFKQADVVAFFYRLNEMHPEVAHAILLNLKATYDSYKR